MVLVKSIVQVIVFFPKRYTRHLFSTDFHKMLTFCIWQFHNSNTLDSVSKSIRGTVLTTVRERSVKFQSKRHSKSVDITFRHKYPTTTRAQVILRFTV